MKDIISLNRSFLLLARQHADDPVASLATGLPKETLKVLEGLSIEQIDTLAANLPLSVFTMRLNPSQIEVAAKDDQHAASRFMVSALAAKNDAGVAK